MEIRKVLSFGILVALCACTEDRLEGLDVIDPNITETSDLFNFTTREYGNLNISALNGDGAGAQEITFSVYAENPYNSDGSRLQDISPIYIGTTGESGTLSAEVAIANDIEKFYVVPEVVGFGRVREVTPSELSSLVFQSTVGASVRTKAVNAAVSDRGFFEIKVIDRSHKIYSYWNDSEINTSDEWHLKFESELVSDNAELLNQTGFLSKVSKQFPELGYPEHSDYYTESFLSRRDNELTVRETGPVYITYIGDCGLSASNKYGDYLNTLCYYTYVTNPLILSFTDVRKTVAIPNTSRETEGKRIQLMYWNGLKYVPDFPAGIKIGFCWIREGMNRSGDQKWNIQEKNMLFMHAQLNQENQQEAPGRKFIQSYGVDVEGTKENCVVGFEITDVLHHEPQFMHSDEDFNDMLLYVENVSSELPPTPPCYDRYSIHGTLVYEDNWPWMGDYDFNDQVVDYTYTVFKERRSCFPWSWITGIELDFSVRAIGAEFHNGFAIKLPFAKNNIKTATMDGNDIKGSLDSDSDGNIILRVYDDTRSAFNALNENYINTIAHWSVLTPSSTKITLELNNCIEENPTFNFHTYNPFIHKTENIAHEIHLVDFPGTDKYMDKTLYGRGDDMTVEGKAYFRAEKKDYVWALDIPRKNAKSITWKYPVEFCNIKDAYNGYENWVMNQLITTESNRWYQEKNAVKGKIYPTDEKLY